MIGPGQGREIDIQDLCELAKASTTSLGNAVLLKTQMFTISHVEALVLKVVPVRNEALEDGRTIRALFSGLN